MKFIKIDVRLSVIRLGAIIYKCTTKICLVHQTHFFKLNYSRAIRAGVALVVVILLLKLSLAGKTNEDVIIASDWHLRETQGLRKRIDAAISNYAKNLGALKLKVDDRGHTLQALGLLAALPRLPETERKDLLTIASDLVKSEAKDFWPENIPNRDSIEVADLLHPSRSYHLPLILMLLEQLQAGALLIDDPISPRRDREMQFAMLPAKPMRKHIVSLLALLIAANHEKGINGCPVAFDAPLQKEKIWGYRSFGCHPTDSCTSPTGMAAIGLSAAVFGLNALEYDEDDYKIIFDGKELNRKMIIDRLTDVCIHLIVTLEQTPRDESELINVDKVHVDARGFTTLLAAGEDGVPLARIQSRKPLLLDLPAIYSYQKNANRGAYYSACVAYTLPTAARVLTLLLEREKNVGANYRFDLLRPGFWKLTIKDTNHAWEARLIPETTRRWSSLVIQDGNNPPLNIEGAIGGALNACVACVTEQTGEGRRLREFKAHSSEAFIINATTAKDHLARFASIHAFALYKASVATGDGYIIGRWRCWEELSEGLCNEKLMGDYLKKTSGTETAATYAFAIMTMTRTFRPIFPKSNTNP